MITNFKIFEGKQVGVIYHFTSIYNLYDILRDNSFLRRGLGRIRISCTRNYNMKSKELKLEKQCCRITLDGNKLSHKYKIEPHLDPNYPDKEEREERIILDRSLDPIDLKKYAIRIDILNEPTTDEDPHAINSYTFEPNQYLHKEEDIRKWYELFKDKIKNLNIDIPIFFVDKMKPVR
jgi:hypothetical protein